MLGIGAYVLKTEYDDVGYCLEALFAVMVVFGCTCIGAYRVAPVCAVYVSVDSAAASAAAAAAAVAAAALAAAALAALAAAALAAAAAAACADTVGARRAKRVTRTRTVSWALDHMVMGMGSERG